MTRSLIAAVCLVALATACGAGSRHAAVNVRVKVDWGMFAHRKPSSFSLTCRPTGGTLPDSARVCADIGRHRRAMLSPPKPRWVCAGAVGGPTLSVTTTADGVTRTFGGEPGCDWPVGATLEVYWEAIRRDTKALGRIEPTLRCEEDPVLLARPTPDASAVACAHGLWTPRSEWLIRLAARVVPAAGFPHDIGARACMIDGVRGLCGVEVKGVWSTPVVTFVETWHTGRRRFVVSVEHGTPHLLRRLASFDPQSFTAVGDDAYWVLGNVPCASGRCFTILRTADGGRTFNRIAVPPLPTSGVTPSLRFADARDGFAFVPGVGGVLYATHDAGSSWQRVSLGTQLGFATGSGSVYLVTADCTLQRCNRYRFERASVAGGVWTSSPLPFVPDGPVVDLSAHGSNVWLLGTRAMERSTHDVLARSNDGGRTFVTGPGPCVPGLGGTLQPSSAEVMWAVCPTGMLAGAWRSRDGGATFAPLRTPELPNSAAIAPASDTSAVLALDPSDGLLLRTIDRGGSWHPAGSSGKGKYVSFVGFTDGSVGAAIVATSDESANVLLRTTDGGTRWTPVPFDLVG